jgi:IS605 OrfB family transposase
LLGNNPLSATRATTNVCYRELTEHANLSGSEKHEPGANARAAAAQNVLDAIDDDASPISRKFCGQSDISLGEHSIVPLAKQYPDAVEAILMMDKGDTNRAEGGRAYVRRKLDLDGLAIELPSLGVPLGILAKEGYLTEAQACAEINEIVAEAVAHDCDVIVFEDLTDIRERLPHADWHHIWAFRRLVEYVEYKPPERGVTIEQVEPDHTSQRCSHTDCGFTHEDNRDGEQFKCLNCGYEINADYNGAKNVGLRYMRKRQHRLRSSPTSGGADAPVDVRVNGGMLNGGGYRPTAGS